MPPDLEMGTQLAVARSVLRLLVAEAAAAYPRECCGLLLGAGSVAAVAPARNVAADPERRFEIDPAALVAAHRQARAGGPRLLGYYHSHPNGSAEPSALDRACAAGDGRVWGIVASGTVNFWRDLPAGFEALSYAETDG